MKNVGINIKTGYKKKKAWQKINNPGDVNELARERAKHMIVLDSMEYGENYDLIDWGKRD